MSTMDTGDLFTFVGLIILICASAFFSAAETSYTSMNIVRIKHMAAEGDKRAAEVLKLGDDFDKLISTILIGNNVVNILTTALITAMLIRFLGDKGVSLATFVSTVIILFFGEVTPKTITKPNAEKVSLTLYPVLHIIIVLLTPFTWLLGCWQKLIGKAVKADDHGFTEDEIITIVEEAENEGEIDAHESELIRSAIEFNDVDVEEILTPRVELEAIDIDTADDEIEKTFAESGYSRLPVYQETVDNIVGVLHEKDFYVSRGKKQLRDMMRTPLFVPQNTKVSDLLKRFQKSKMHLAVVMDEYDGVLGIVTMEDILEELVGEIWDEHDEVVEDYRRIDDDVYIVDGGANLDDMLELFDIRKEYDPVTVNGWVQECLGRFPKAGDSFECEGLKVTVEKADKRRATELRVERSENGKEDK